MHKSVMLEEVIRELNLKDNSIVVDCTLGYGGHSEEILKRIPNGFLYAFDQDEEAISYSNDRLRKVNSNFKIIYSNFENLKDKLNELGIDKVDAILFDLGFSSPQIDDEKRGFSFMKDARLDMRMDRNSNIDAHYIVNNYSYEELKNIFYNYAEEKYSNSIAHNIVSKRPIDTTMELVSIIRNSVPLKYANTRHPERVIFQALRIEVNRELEVLKHVLPDAIDILNKNGRLAVITFHSLEDRIVKQIFKNYSEVPKMFKGLPDVPNEYREKIKLINKKPIIPREEECINNSRAKSSKLRVIERV